MHPQRNGADGAWASRWWSGCAIRSIRAQIVALYDVLLRLQPSPVVELNRAVAMRDGPQADLALVDALLECGELPDYRLAHAARADFLRRLGRNGEALAAYGRALALTRQAPERRFLERRMAEMAN